MNAFDVEWAGKVREQCDPIFDAARVGFQCQIIGLDESNSVRGLLWEADPALFAARFPDSGIAETYGDDWENTSCIDYEVTVDESAQQLVLAVEGWNLPEMRLAASGKGQRDGARLADLLARILGVRSPRVS